jgi:hypothetical protein
LAGKRGHPLASAVGTDHPGFAGQDLAGPDLAGPDVKTDIAQREPRILLPVEFDFPRPEKEEMEICPTLIS